MMYHLLVCPLVAIWPEQKGAPDPPTSASPVPLEFLHCSCARPQGYPNLHQVICTLAVEYPDHMQHLAKTRGEITLAMSAFDADPDVLKAWHGDDTLSNRAMSCCKIPNILHKKICRGDVIENYMLLNPIIEHLGCKPHIESITRGKPEPTSGLHYLSCGCLFYFTFSGDWYI